MLFHLANAAMLPLMGSVVTMRSAEWATVLIAACIVVPQLVVAALSPWVGHHAQIWGRRPFMLIAFAALPIRGLLFAIVTDPYLLVAVQVLDGITAASLGVMVPLMIADLTRGTGRFNLAQGRRRHRGGDRRIDQPDAGRVSDRRLQQQRRVPRPCGRRRVGSAVWIACWALMPETRPRHPGAARSTGANCRPTRVGAASLSGVGFVTDTSAAAALRDPSGCDRPQDSRAPCAAP